MKKFVTMFVVLVTLVSAALSANAELRVNRGIVRSKSITSLHDGTKVFDNYYYIEIESEIGETYEIEVTKEEFEKETGHKFDENGLDKGFDEYVTYQELGLFGKTTRMSYFKR